MGAGELPAWWRPQGGPARSVRGRRADRRRRRRGRNGCTWGRCHHVQATTGRPRRHRPARATRRHAFPDRAGRRHPACGAGPARRQPTHPASRSGEEVDPASGRWTRKLRCSRSRWARFRRSCPVHRRGPMSSRIGGSSSRSSAGSQPSAPRRSSSNSRRRARMTSASSLLREEGRTRPTLGRDARPAGRPPTSVDRAWTCGRGRRPERTRGAFCAACGTARSQAAGECVPGGCPASWPASGDTTMPTAPGPTWAPIAAPSSLTNSSVTAGSRSRSSAARRSARSGAARWCTATRHGPVPRCLGCALDQPGERAPEGAHLLQRQDLAVAHVEQRLDRQGRAEHRGRRSDPATTAQVLERVDDEERAGRGRRRPRDLGHVGRLGSVSRRTRRGQDGEADTHGRGAGVHHRHQVLADLRRRPAAPRHTCRTVPTRDAPTRCARPRVPGAAGTPARSHRGSGATSRPAGRVRRGPGRRRQD